MFNQPGPGGPQQQLPMSNIIAALSLMALVYVAYFFLFPQPALENDPGTDNTTSSASASESTAFDDNAVLEFIRERFGKGEDLTKTTLSANGDQAGVGYIDESSAIFHSLTLTDYRETLDEGSPDVSLLSYEGAPYPYMVQPFVSDDINGGDKDQTPLNFQSQPSQTGGISLAGTSENGLDIQVHYDAEGPHLYRIRMEATNTSDRDQDVVLGARLLRAARLENGEFVEIPGVQSIWTARVGSAYFDGDRVRRQAYNQMADAVAPVGTGNDWIALADKYFMTAFLPINKAETASSYRYLSQSGFFSARMMNTGQGLVEELAPGESSSFEFFLFAGPKELDLLRKYESDLGAEQFAFTIDFGWFWYFTMPFTIALAWLGDLVGNVGVAILIITVIIKLFLFPLANNSYRSMARMKKLQPKMEELREKHSDDRQAMSQATMALYRQEGANPVAGCLPILVQIPIFFALYKVIFNTIEIRHAPFFGWVQDMSVADPTSWINLFGLLPFDVPGIFAAGGLLALLSVGIWPILMGLTMVWQQRLSPAPTDPTQAMVMRFLPIIFTFFMATFPAGLVIYWTWNNFLSVLQQMVIMRGTKTETEEKKEAETERQKAKAASRSKK